MTAALQFRDLTLGYDRHPAVHHLDGAIETGALVAVVGPNGAGKSTLMRLLSGEDEPSAGTRSVGHNVVVQSFAQDEATRLDPAPTVYETLASGSRLHMVPMIRNSLGGFLCSGDDVYKPVRVLSGGERTRLAVARMLLRPSNTLLLDEPTNHLDLDSKEVLLDALVDYGGTLIFVSHDRYFVERLATKIIEVGNGAALMYPGTYNEFLWHKANAGQLGQAGQVGKDAKAAGARRLQPSARDDDSKRVQRVATPDRQEKKRVEAEARKQSRALQARKQRIDLLESRISAVEQEIRDVERAMAAQGFYDDRAAAQPVIDRHQALMWEIGDLMHQWEELQATLDLASAQDV